MKDQDGHEIFVSGTRDERHFIQPGSFIFKAEAVDQYGNLIDRHNLWEMVGVRFRRSLFPGFSDKADFAFPCPTSMTATQQKFSNHQDFNFRIPEHRVTALQIDAKLMYRKIDQFLLIFKQ